MLPTLLSEVAIQCGGQLYAACECDAHTAVAAKDISVRGVVSDNRAIMQGDLFVAIAGERIDGNVFAGDAMNRGASGVLTQDVQAALKGGADPHRLIVVDDVYTALGNLAREQLKCLRDHGREDFTVIGVTGSVGKTSTKDLLGALLAQRGPAIVPPGSFNNELGLPLTVLRADASTATLVLEMGAGAPGDLAYLASIAPPDIAVVLIVARAHLGFMGGIEAVARAKQELVESTRAGGIIFLNADDERVAAMSAAAPSGSEVRYFSAHPAPETQEDRSYRGVDIARGVDSRAEPSLADPSICASDIVVNPEGHAQFVLHTPTGSAPVTLALVGEHHVANALAAASVAYELGIPLADIVRILSETGPISEHRMNVTEAHGITLIDDSYNANPDSARAGIDAAVHIAAGKRTVAILGQMAELGEVAGQEHRALGHYAAASGVSRIVAVGDGVDELAAGAREAGMELVDHVRSEDALCFVQSIIDYGDVVLLKGSHSSGVWRVADALHEWLGDFELASESDKDTQGMRENVSSEGELAKGDQT